MSMLDALFALVFGLSMGLRARQRPLSHCAWLGQACPPRLHPAPLLPPPPRADFRGALAAAFGSEPLLRAFAAVRRSEWEHFRDMPLEREAALLYARY